MDNSRKTGIWAEKIGGQMESIGHEMNGHAPLAQGPEQTEESSANGNGHSRLPEATAEEETANAEKAANAHKVRKRTKTGCLTCRRRRIKCGEERPTCKNCTKSKRECEGYVPRVVFKDPVSAFRPNWDASYEHQLHSHFDPNGTGFGPLSSMTADGVPLAPLAPRPSYEEYGLGHSSRIGDHFATPGSDGYAAPGINNQINPNMFAMPTGRPTHMLATNGHDPALHAADRRASVTSPTSVSPQEAWERHFGDLSATSSHSMPSTTWSHDQASSIAQTTPYPTPLTGNSTDGSFPTPTWPVPGQSNHPETPLHPRSMSYDQRRLSTTGDLSQQYVGHQIQSQNQLYDVPPDTPVQPSFQEPEEELFDVDSDEEDAKVGQLNDVQSSDLGRMLQISARQTDTDVRSITNCLNSPNILATYQPAYAASPLKDSHTARVFCHFITATGPTLNVCERHPANPSVIFSGRPVPQAQRALWSYTLPMLALKHQGLLHSMLALSSLHIAKLQHTSPTPSLKHYHYALRRVAKALGNPNKRGDVATLAATLLLGFYEVATAEHSKWNSHLSGARELISEIDFAKMARRIEAHRSRQEEDEARSRSYSFNGYTNVFFKPSQIDMPAQAARRLDENLISTLTGFSTRYNDYGQVIDDTEPIPATEEPLKPKDIEHFQVQCDLFWWYAKQDVYQSILSNNRLL